MRLLLRTAALLSLGIIHLALSLDKTRIDNSTGCEVTAASVNKVQTSGIFKDDHFLLYRVALVSDFGKNIFVHKSHGIWQLTEANLKTAKAIAARNNLEQKIEENFDVKLRHANVADLYKPLVCCLTAFLLIQDDGGNIPMRFQNDEQLTFWTRITGIPTTSSFSGKFNDAVEALDTNDGQSGTECLVCHEQPTDIVFVMDDSGSISESQWRMQKDFVLGVLEKFKESLDTSATQAAYVIFESNIAATVQYSSNYLHLSKYFDTYERTGGGTDIAIALEKALSIVNGTSKSRVRNSAVKKLIILLTDGQGGDISVVAPLLKTLPVQVYAIGMTSGADLGTLELAASKPEYVRTYESVKNFKSDIADISYSTCTANAEVETESMNSTDNNTLVFSALKVNQSRYYDLSVKNNQVARLTVGKSDLDIQLYASFSQKRPNDADFDFKYRIPPHQMKVIFISKPDTSSGGNESATLGLLPVAENCLTAICNNDIEIAIKSGPKKESDWPNDKIAFEKMMQALLSEDATQNDGHSEQNVETKKPASESLPSLAVVGLIALLCGAAIIGVFIMAGSSRSPKNQPPQVTLTNDFEEVNCGSFDDLLTVSAADLASSNPFQFESSAGRVDYSETVFKVNLTNNYDYEEINCGTTPEQQLYEAPKLEYEQVVPPATALVAELNFKGVSKTDEGCKSEQEKEQPSQKAGTVPTAGKGPDLMASIPAGRNNLKKASTGGTEGANVEGGMSSRTEMKDERSLLSEINSLAISRAVENLRTNMEDRIRAAKSARGGDFWEQMAQQNEVLGAAANILKEMQSMTQLQPSGSFSSAVKSVSASGVVIMKFARLIADRCVDQNGAAAPLRKSCEPISTLSTQLSVLAGVKAKSVGVHESDDALVAAMNNLVCSVLETLVKIEACSLKGLEAKPEDAARGSEGEKALAIATEWKRSLDEQRKQDESGASQNQGLKGNTKGIAAKEPNIKQYLS